MKEIVIPSSLRGSVGIWVAQKVFPRGKTHQRELVGQFIQYLGFRSKAMGLGPKESNFLF